MTVGEMGDLEAYSILYPIRKEKLFHLKKVNNYSKFSGNIGKSRTKLVNYFCKYSLKIRYP